MEDENRPPPDEAWKPANDNYPRQALDDDSDIPPWQRLDKVVLSIARLIGRQMAREDFERLGATNDNDPGTPREDRAEKDWIERTFPITRVALYARYSTDNQREASIEDQLRLCRERAQREGWQIIGTYADAAISGASMVLRPGIKSLLADAQGGRFDAVMAEALDRRKRCFQATALSS